MKGKRKRKHESLTCVRKQRMIIAVIVEFGPHAKGELFQVGQLNFVMNVLGKKVTGISTCQIFLILVSKEKFLRSFIIKYLIKFNFYFLTKSFFIFMAWLNKDDLVTLL